MARNHSKYPAIFFDRDGTIIRERNYLRFVRDVRLLKGAGVAMRRLQEAGYKLIVITNQSGIGRGYFTENKLHRIHARLEKLLRREGVVLDGIYYCPHHPDHDCECRKPRPGMIRRAAREHAIDLKRSFSIGDKTGDVIIGQKAGGAGILVLTGHGPADLKKIGNGGAARPDFIARNLTAAAGYIINRTHTS